MARILVIDDDASILESLTLFLEGEGHVVICSSEGRDARALVEAHQPELILLDLRMVGTDGFTVLRDLEALIEAIPVIMITAHDDMENAIQASSLGVFDFISKPVDIDVLSRVMDEALCCARKSRDEDTYGINFIPTLGERVRIIGKSPGMLRIFRQIGQVARNRVTVLIQGESGTGKELIARIIHNSGPSRLEPFVAVNCSALPEGLLESELFGHVRGAFTGAIRTKKGKFELAGRGTIFLDEVSELPLGLQAKLLRVLQEREFDPVGGEGSLPLRARVITSSNMHLTHLVRDGRFREDLFYRLNVYEISIPPLRDRTEDILPLIEYFLCRFQQDDIVTIKRITSEAVTLLRGYAWPGNVRELEHMLLQSSLQAHGGVLRSENLTLPEAAGKDKAEWEPEFLPLSLEEIERMHIGRVLAHVGGNKRAACEILGISKPTLYSKIRRYGIQPAIFTSVSEAYRNALPPFSS
ncbi:MAG: sigma-54-dependent Fis family transcriptional regulator [Bacteroidetes bacterium]|nr:sigma-54-dependent Fis family transcriptional regulator [Bacteroidota bacterium]